MSLFRQCLSQERGQLRLYCPLLWQAFHCGAVPKPTDSWTFEAFQKAMKSRSVHRPKPLLQSQQSTQNSRFCSHPRCCSFASRKEHIDCFMFVLLWVTASDCLVAIGGLGAVAINGDLSLSCPVGLCSFPKSKERMCLAKLLQRGACSPPGTFLQQCCAILKRLTWLSTALPWSFTVCDRCACLSVGRVDFSSDSTFRRLLSWSQLSHNYCICLAAHRASRVCCYTRSGPEHTAVSLLVATAYVKSFIHPSSPWDQPTARVRLWMVLPHRVLRRQHGNQALTPGMHKVQDRWPLAWVVTSLLAVPYGSLASRVTPCREDCLWQPGTSTARVTMPFTLPPNSHWKAA